MNTLIKLEHLSKRFGDLEVLKDINIDIKEGEVICVIGPSGSGKSTMLRCINQLETPTGGEIIYDNKNVTAGEIALRDMREEVGMVFQRFNLFPMKTVLENVMLAPVLTQKKDKHEAKRIGMELLDKVGLASKANVYPKTLSGGQQQRVAILQAVPDMHRTKLLLPECLSCLPVRYAG